MLLSDEIVTTVHLLVTTVHLKGLIKKGSIKKGSALVLIVAAVHARYVFGVTNMYVCISVQ